MQADGRESFAVLQKEIVLKILEWKNSIKSWDGRERGEQGRAVTGESLSTRS